MISKITTMNMVGIADGDITLGILNKVSGRNGAGKTSVARAVLWAITGRDLNGSVVTDKYQKDVEQPLEVSVRFGNGFLGGEVRRRRTKSRTVVAMGGNPTTDEEVQKALGMPVDAFATMFFPGYFFMMNDADRRALFLAITPKADEAKIFAEMTGGLALDLSIPIEKQFKDWNQERLYLERELAKIEGSLKEAMGQEPMLMDTGMSSAEMTAKRMALNARYKEESGKAQDARSYASKLALYHMEVKQHQERVAKLEEVKKHNAMVAEKSAQAVDLKPLQAKCAKAQEARNQAATNLAECHAYGKSLVKTLEELKSKPTNCSMCGQALPVGNLEEKVKELQANVDHARKEYQDYQSMLNSADVKLEESKKALIEAQSKNAELGSLTMQEEPVIPVLSSGPQGEFLSEEAIKELEETAAATAREIGALSNAIHLCDQNEERMRTREKRLAALEGQKIDFEARLHKARLCEDALHPKGLPARALREQLEKVTIPGFKFVFSETLKNGTERECFKVLRDDGVLVESLSSGEKVKFCLGLSSLIAMLTNAPLKSVFIENADLVDAVPRLHHFQMIVERVAKDQDLQIQIL